MAHAICPKRSAQFFSQLKIRRIVPYGKIIAAFLNKHLFNRQIVKCFAPGKLVFIPPCFKQMGKFHNQIQSMCFPQKTGRFPPYFKKSAAIFNQQSCCSRIPVIFIRIPPEKEMLRAVPGKCCARLPVVSLRIPPYFKTVAAIFRQTTAEIPVEILRVPPFYKIGNSAKIRAYLIMIRKTFYFITFFEFNVCLRLFEIP